MSQFNPMIVIEAFRQDTVEPNDRDNVVDHLHQIIDKIKTGEYTALQGDLIGFNEETAVLDIISTNIHQGERYSSLLVDTIECGSTAVAMILHDTLLDTTRVIIDPVFDEEGSTVGYELTKGYEEFTMSIITLGLKEEVEEKT